MSILYSNQYQISHVDRPSERVSPVDHTGRVRVAYGKITFAEDVIGIGVIVKLFKLPAGARVFDWWIKHGDLGTTGVGKVGIPGADAIFGSHTMTAAGLVRPAVANTGLAYDIAQPSPVDVQLEITTATDDADGISFEMAVFYVLD
jgi:hypothetical protein